VEHSVDTVEEHINRERFRGFVELSGTERQYISKVEERRLLEQGISHFKLDPDVARGIVLDVAHANDVQLERDIDRRIAQVLERDGGKNKKISRREFKRTARLYNVLAGGVLTKEEAQVRVKQVMEGNKFRPKRGGLTYTRRWYHTVGESKKENGIVPPLLSRDI
jgi:hypothetical protein